MRFRAEAVTAFLADLELIRLGVVARVPAAPFGEIHVTRTDVSFTIDGRAGYLSLTWKT